MSHSNNRQKKRKVSYSELTSSAPLYFSSFQARHLVMNVWLISGSKSCRRELWKAMNSDVLKMFRQHWPFFLHLLGFRQIGMLAFSKSMGVLDRDGSRDDNISRPVACQSGKISMFLGYIFIFKEKTHSVNCIGF